MLSELLKRPVIPVIVIEDANDAEPLAEALLKGGMDLIEITCRTAAAPEALARIKKAFPEMLLGAGTVVTPDQAKMCIDTGVGFGLAPGLNLDTVEFFQASETLFIPGVMTPSEIERGLALGCKLLKFNMNDYLALPIVSAIGGSWLATKQQIADKQWSVITDQVKAALAKATAL